MSATKTSAKENLNKNFVIFVWILINKMVKFLVKNRYFCLHYL